MTRRSRFLFLTVAFVALPSWTHAVEVKFMTYNVRAPGWSQARRAQVVAAIYGESPDVLGLHEAQAGGNGDELLADLQTDYEPHHTSTSDPIYLRRDRSFQVVEKGVLTLTACRVGGPIDLTWVKIATLEGARFIFYSVHPCVSSAPLGGDPEGNQIQAIEAVSFMETNAEGGAPHLLAGDLNANQNSPTLMYLRDGAPLTIGGQTFINPIDLDDSWEMARDNDGLVKPGTGTFTGSAAVLDWILVEPTAEVTAAEVIEFVIPPGEEDNFSDHLPVTATLDLPVFAATDQTVSGKKLLIKNKSPDDKEKNKAVWVAKDPSIIAGTRESENDPRCNTAPQGTVKSSLRFLSSSSGQDTGALELPCQNWSALGSETDPKGYRYKDAELDQGPCKLVLVKDRSLIKAVCLGRGAATDFLYDLTEGTDESVVDVVLTTGKLNYCSAFDDFNGKNGADGKLFLGKNAPAPSSCSLRRVRERPLERTDHRHCRKASWSRYVGILSNVVDRSLYVSSSSSAFASFKSCVSKPSVNQSYIGWSMRPA